MKVLFSQEGLHSTGKICTVQQASQDNEFDLICHRFS